MATNILFVLEGKKEDAITKNLSQFFVNENTLITCVYGTVIYQLYQKISTDEDLDTFSLLKETNTHKEVLKDFKRADFAEIYLFFDYDGHASNAGNEKLKALLEFFDEETDKGKLYISYPMVEALKHIENFETFKTLKVHCKIDNYKKLVNENCIKLLIDFNVYDLSTWQEVIEAHLKKMNVIVNDIDELPTTLIKQFNIFEQQLAKYIKTDKTVAVLSAFPVFLHDYYGNEELKRRLGK